MTAVSTRRSSRRRRASADYLTLAIRYLARTDRTAAQVERYVHDKGARRAEGRVIVRELERRGYLNHQANRIGDNDTGPNTGGMGAVSPVVFADSVFLKKVEDNVIKPTSYGLAKEGIPYKGFIFIGLMNVGGEPYVIEYNARMGDPETQVVLPRIKTDFVSLLHAAATGALKNFSIETHPEYAVTLSMVSGGYPGDYEKGKPITGLERVTDAVAFHAAQKRIKTKSLPMGVV